MKNFVKSDCQAVRQEFLFIKRRSSQRKKISSSNLKPPPTVCVLYNDVQAGLLSCSFVDLRDKACMHARAGGHGAGSLLKTVVL